MLPHPGGAEAVVIATCNCGLGGAECDLCRIQELQEEIDQQRTRAEHAEARVAELAAEVDRGVAAYAAERLPTLRAFGDLCRLMSRASGVRLSVFVDSSARCYVVVEHDGERRMREAGDRSMESVGAALGLLVREMFAERSAAGRALIEMALERSLEDGA